MGNTLTGQIVAETYDSLLKVTDNNQITGTKKRLTDGFGTDTPLLVSTTDVQVDGNFLIESAQFNTATIQTGGIGKLIWNDQDGTLDLGLKGGNVTLQVGQEQVIRVVNKTGSNLLEANYQVVRVDGAQGNRLKVALAQANNDANSAETLGLVTETINDNQEGFITTSGLVRNINTTGSLQGETWADGDMLYLSGTTAGRLTNIKPAAPTHTVIMGYVVRAHATQGQIFVKVDNGYELDELHNVSITTPTDGQVLAYEASTGLWKNTTNGNIGGSGSNYYIPRFTGGTSISNSVIYQEPIFNNIGIGTTNVNSLLHLHKSSTNTQVGISLTDATTTDSANKGFNIIKGADQVGYLWNYQNSSIVIGTNNSERVRITNSGNIGIGTTTPSTKLDVNGDITSSGLIYSNLINSTFTVGSKLGLPVLGSSPSADPVYHSLHSTNENELTWLQPSSIGGDSPSTFKAVNTAARVYTFPDATGTVALTSNINSAISGTTNYLSKFTGSNSIGNSQIFDNGTNIGIGTTSPSFKLTTNFSAPSSFTNAAGDFVQMWQASGTNGLGVAMSTGDSVARLVTNNGYQLAITAGGTETARFTSSGLVGIGTTSPSVGKLHIQYDYINNRALRLQDTNGIFDFITSGGGQNHSFGLYDDTNGAYRLFVTSDGKVGIGTTSPTQKLDVNGNIALSFNGENIIVNDQRGTDSISIRGAANVNFHTFNGSSMVERMRITSGGNVGIGTTSPSEKLSVVGGNISLGAGYKLQYSSTAYITPENNVSGAEIATGGILTIKTGGTSERVRVDASGNVGIGTTSPGYTLHVNGSVAGTSAYVNLSDERYKKDIQPIENALDKILSLNGITFNWDKSNTDMNLDDANHIGLIAQDVEKVLPQAVTTGSDENKIKSVAYTDIVPVLIEAIKELTEKVNQLENK